MLWILIRIAMASVWVVFGSASFEYLLLVYMENIHIHVENRKEIQISDQSYSEILKMAKYFSLSESSRLNPCKQINIENDFLSDQSKHS